MAHPDQEQWLEIFTQLYQHHPAEDAEMLIETAAADPAVFAAELFAAHRTGALRLSRDARRVLRNFLERASEST